MASKMSMLREDSFVGYDKRTANYTQHDQIKVVYDSEDEDIEDFYDHYEPFEEDFDDGDYQPFDPEEEEKEHQSQISPKTTKTIKPLVWINSPNKSDDKSSSSSSSSSTKPPSPTWWDKNEIIDDSKRMINGVLNYAALLPPPSPKIEPPPPPVQQPKNKTKKNKKNRPNLTKTDEKKIKYDNGTKQSQTQQQVQTSEVQKPTRFCLSVVKKTKCFHGTRCRFAHNYNDLKECNFGDRCKKILFVKTNPDGTIELANKNEVVCNFKHNKESQSSYLKRVPQQHTSPKK